MSHSRIDMSSMEVLVVDDNVHMRRILRSILSGFEIRKVMEAGDGAEALEALERNPSVDFILTDWEMPVVDGMELVRLIRNPDHACCYTPIFMITGHSTRARVRQAIKAGVHEVLCKPVVPRHLHERLTATLVNPRPFVRMGTYFGPEPRTPKSTAMERTVDDLAAELSGRKPAPAVAKEPERAPDPIKHDMDDVNYV